MYSRFHSPNLSAKRNLTRYQPVGTRTTRLLHPAGAIVCGGLIAALLAGTLAWAIGAPADKPAFGPDLHGFAPLTRNLFHPLLSLAPGQPERALAAYEDLFALERGMVVHPTLSPELQGLIDRLPAPEMLPIEAAALYSSAAIPWQTGPPEVHYLTIAGHPKDADFLYRLTAMEDPPQVPGQLAATISLRPTTGQGESVVAESKVELYFSSTVAPTNMTSMVADSLGEIYGTLAPPWDEQPGVFNQHDRAAMARFTRDMPVLSARVDHYFRINNLMDEFNNAAGPWVLFNLNLEIRDEALAPYPHLRAFYQGFASRVEAQSVTRDERGRQWIRVGFDRGRISLAFMLRRGMLTPMNDQLEPAGPPMTLEQAAARTFHTDSSVSEQGFGLRFGLEGIRFVTAYSNHNGKIRFDGRLTDVPRLIAPPIVRPLTMLLAGQFMETLAKGNGGRGIATSFSALPGPRGGTMVGASFSGEFQASAALALIARLAGAIAPSNSTEVRAEERRLADEFFAALAADYARARPALLDAK